MAGNAGRIRYELIVDDRGTPVVRQFGDNAAQAGRRAGRSMNDFNKAALGAVAGIAAVGAAIAKAAQIADEFDSANKRMAAQIGKTAEATAHFGDISERVYGQGIGQSVGAVTDVVVQALQQFENANDATLEYVSRTAISIQDAFGDETQSIITASANLVEKFGITNQQAFDLITRGYQNGLNASGDFLDSINEYSVQFADGGASAEQFFSVLESGMQGGVLGTDKAADAFKEFRVRIQDGSKATNEALGLLGISADDFAAKMADGSITAADAFQIVIEKLRETDDSSIKMQAGVGLLGTQFEDLGQTAALSLDMTSVKMSDAAGAADSLNVQYETLGQSVTYFGRQVELTVSAVMESFNGDLRSVFVAMGQWLENTRSDFVAAFDNMQMVGLSVFEALADGWLVIQKTAEIIINSTYSAWIEFTTALESACLTIRQAAEGTWASVRESFWNAIQSMSGGILEFARNAVSALEKIPGMGVASADLDFGLTKLEIQIGRMKDYGQSVDQVAAAHKREYDTFIQVSEARAASIPTAQESIEQYRIEKAVIEETVNDRLKDIEGRYKTVEVAEKQIEAHESTEKALKATGKAAEDMGTKTEKAMSKAASGAKKAADEFARMKTKFTEDFNRATLESFDYELLKLDEQRAAYEQAGIEKNQIDQWYFAEYDRLIENQAEKDSRAAEQSANEKKRIEEKLYGDLGVLNDNYYSMQLEKIDAEVKKMEEAGMDAIDVARWRDKQLADLDAERGREMQNQFSNFATMFKGMAEGNIQSWAQMLGMMGQGWDGLFGSLINSASSAMGGIWDMLKKGASSIGGMFSGDSGGGFWGSLVSGVSSIFGGGDSGGGFLSGIADTVGGWLGSGDGGWFDSITSSIGGVFDGVSDWVGNAWDGVKSWFGDAKSGITDTLSGLLKSSGLDASKLVSGISSGIMSGGGMDSVFGAIGGNGAVGGGDLLGIVNGLSGLFSGDDQAQIKGLQTVGGVLEKMGTNQAIGNLIEYGNVSGAGGYVSGWESNAGSGATSALGSINYVGGAVNIGSQLLSGEGLFNNKYDNEALGVLQTLGSFTKYGGILSTAGEWLGGMFNETGAQVGAGIGAGAGVGATVGSVIPGIGTAIGAAVGAIIGGIASAFGATGETREELDYGEFGLYDTVNVGSHELSEGGDREYGKQSLNYMQAAQQEVWDQIDQVMGALPEKYAEQFKDEIGSAKFAVGGDMWNIREEHMGLDFNTNAISTMQRMWGGSQGAVENMGQSVTDDFSGMFNADSEMGRMEAYLKTGMGDVKAKWEAYSEQYAHTVEGNAEVFSSWFEETFGDYLNTLGTYLEKATEAKGYLEELENMAGAESAETQQGNKLQSVVDILDEQDIAVAELTQKYNVYKQNLIDSGIAAEKLGVIQKLWGKDATMLLEEFWNKRQDILAQAETDAGRNTGPEATAVNNITDSVNARFDAYQQQMGQLGASLEELTQLEALRNETLEHEIGLLAEQRDEILRQAGVMAGVVEEISALDKEIANINSQFDQAKTNLQALNASVEELGQLEEFREAAIEQARAADEQAKAAETAAAAQAEAARMAELEKQRLADLEAARQAAYQEQADRINRIQNVWISAMQEVQNLINQIKANIQSARDLMEQLNWQSSTGGTSTDYMLYQFETMMETGVGTTLDGLVQMSEMLSKWYQAAASAAANQAESAISAASATSSAAGAMTEAAVTIIRMAEAVEDTIKSIKYSDLNISLAKEKETMAAGDYQSLKSAAYSESATQENVQDFLDFASTYLDYAQAEYKSSDTYQGIYAQVLADVEGLRDKTFTETSASSSTGGSAGGSYTGGFPFATTGYSLEQINAMFEQYAAWIEEQMASINMDKEIILAIDWSGLEGDALAVMSMMTDIVDKYGWDSEVTMTFVSEMATNFEGSFQDAMDILGFVGDGSGWSSTATLTFLSDSDLFETGTFEEKMDALGFIADASGSWSSPAVVEFAFSSGLMSTISLSEQMDALGFIASDSGGWTSDATLRMVANFSDIGVPWSAIDETLSAMGVTDATITKTIKAAYDAGNTPFVNWDMLSAAMDETGISATARKTIQGYYTGNMTLADTKALLMDSGLSENITANIMANISGQVSVVMADNVFSSFQTDMVLLDSTLGDFAVMMREVMMGDLNNFSVYDALVALNTEQERRKSETNSILSSIAANTANTAAYIGPYGGWNVLMGLTVLYQEQTKLYSEMLRHYNYLVKIAYNTAYISLKVGGAYQFAYGGIASGPESGYSATLHGTELVVSPKASYPATVIGSDNSKEDNEILQELLAVNRAILNKTNDTYIAVNSSDYKKAETRNNRRQARGINAV